MTREEAIENLKGLLESNYVDRFYDTENEALEMAITALEQEPCEDAISRQAYIERFRKWAYSEYGRKIDNEELAIRVAMSLPPVNPQEPKTDVLDKIRTEIIELRSKQNVGVLECLDIIDKYRESEDKE